MKLGVPFLKAKKDTDCGPLAVKMVIGYFGKEFLFDEILKAFSTGLWGV